MPLYTTITRDGEDLALRWGHFHIVAMTLAAAFDSGEGPFKGEQKPDFSYPAEAEFENKDFAYLAEKTDADYPDVPCPISPANHANLVGYHVLAMTPLNRGSYTLENEHKFLDTTDGEILHLLPGDVLSASRG